MADDNYNGKTLPELYLIASKRGIEHFFPKNEIEMIDLLRQWDADHQASEEGDSMAKPKPAEELDDILEDDDEIDVDEIDESESEDEAEEDAAPKKSKTPKAAKKSGRTDEEDMPEELDDDLDDILNDDLDEEPEEKPKKKGKKKQVDDDDLDEDDDDLDEDDDDLDEDDEQSATSKKGSKDMPRTKRSPSKEKPAEEKKAKKAAPPKKDVPKNGTEGMSPYQSNSAGHFVYIALKKGGSMEKICANAVKLIEKYKVRPPSNMEGKVKIIFTEINSGKKGKEWGKFTKDDNGKISHS